MSRMIRHTSFAVLCATALLGACAKGDATADSARMADSAMAAMPPAAGAPAVMPAAMTDANIMAALDAANVHDSTAGSMAAMKGTNAEVKSYGRDMMRDHHALRIAGQDLGKKLSVTPEPMAGDNTMAMDMAVADSMTATPAGAAWDKFYIEHAIMHHEKVLAMAQTAIGATQNAEVKALLEKAAPNVQAHLERASSIRTKLQ